MNEEKLNKILPKYEPVKLSGKNLAQNYVSAFNTGMNIYQCVNQLQGSIIATVNGVNNVVKSWNDSVDETLNKSIEITEKTTTEQFNKEWENNQPELIEQVNTLTINQFNKEKSVFNDDLKTLNSRMNTFTKLAEGSTSADAELTDIRVGANGITYDTAGDAVRGQYDQLKTVLVDLTINDIVNSYKWKIGSFTSAYDDINGHYTNNDNRFLVCDNFIISLYDIYIESKIDSNVMYNVYLLNDDGVKQINNKQNLDQTNYESYTNHNETYIIPKNTYYRIELYFNDKHIITDNEIQNLLNSINIKSNLVVDIDKNALNLNRLANENFNNSFPWKIGSFSGKYNNINGIYTNDDTRYITMYTFYKLPFDIIVSSNSLNVLYDLYVLTSEGEEQFINNQDISKFNEKLSQSSVNVIKANTYFRVDVRYLDKHDVTNMNELLNSISIVSTLYYNANLNANTTRITKTVGSTNCDFTSLISAIKYAVSRGNVTLELANETFDVSDEVDYINDREGIKVGNGLILKGKANTEIICNYTGNVGTIQRDFSLFSATPSDYILENVTLKATNIRYCVHDECSGTTTPYEHKYINCNMYHDSSNAQWRTSQCIGGGFGTNATCIVDGCVFESVAQYESKTNDIGGPYLEELRADGFSWHANVNDLNACNKLIAVNNFIKGELGTIRYSSGNRGYNLISNNSLGKEPVSYGDTGETIKWNNEIRTN